MHILPYHLTIFFLVSSFGQQAEIIELSLKFAFWFVCMTTDLASHSTCLQVFICFTVQGRVYVSANGGIGECDYANELRMIRCECE